MKNGNDFNMMGIAVGKKFSKSSVKRNRVKSLYLIKINSLVAVFFKI